MTTKHVSGSHNGLGSTGGSARNLRKASPASVHTFRSLSRVRWSSSDLIRGSAREHGAVRREMVIFVHGKTVQRARRASNLLSQSHSKVDGDLRKLYERLSFIDAIWILDIS